VRQPNAGCGAAFNTGFSTAAGDYVALCPADDIWEPHKLEWQSALLAEQPVVDVSFTAAVNFGLVDGPFARPSGDGVLDNEQFRREMFVVNRIPDPSVVLRRDLHAELGGYVPEIGEDYEFWFRALERGAVFHFEPRVTVRLRQHRTNLSANAVAIWRMMVRVHEAHASTFADTDFVNAILARDHRRLARAELGMGNAEAAAAAYRKAAEYGGRRSDRIRASMTGLPVLRPVGRWLSASRGVGA
jgi:glycosyltransferase involved in cell wall biosynthesis